MEHDLPVSVSQSQATIGRNTSLGGLTIKKSPTFDRKSPTFDRKSPSMSRAQSDKNLPSAAAQVGKAQRKEACD